MNEPKEEPQQPQDKPIPPYLNEEQEKQFIESFSMDNFEVVHPPVPDSYLKITIPQDVQHLISVVESQARKGALLPNQIIGDIVMLSASDDEQEVRARKLMQENFEQNAAKFAREFFEMSLDILLYQAIQETYLKELKTINEAKTPTQRDSLWKEYVDRQTAIDSFMFGMLPNNGKKERRYVVYSGDEQVYKTPGDLRIYDSESQSARRN